MIRFVIIEKDGAFFFLRRYESPQEDENPIESEALLISLLKGINTFLVQTSDINYSELVFEDGTRVHRSITEQQGEKYVTYIGLHHLGYQEYQAIQDISKLIENYAYMGQIYSRIIDHSKLELESMVLSELDAIVTKVNGEIPDHSEWDTFQ